MIASLASQLVPIFHSYALHTESLRQTNILHKEKLKKEQHHFKSNLRFKAHLHLRNDSLERELFAESTRYDLEFARREAIRDVWSSRNQLIQTIMVLCALLFSCSFSILRSGQISSSVPKDVLRFFSIILGVSMGSLFIAIWFSLNVQARMARYDMHKPTRMYRCGQQHRTFHSYYQCHCRRIASVAVMLFYVGVLCCLSSWCVLGATILGYTLSNWVGGVFIACGVSTGLFIIPFGELIWPSATTKKSYGGLDVDMDIGSPHDP